MKHNRSVVAAATAAFLSLPLVGQIAEATAAKPADRPFALMVGDKAPALAIQQWVKGEAVESFAADSVYVVEFWATWCGPCIAGMPHLSTLQQEYADQKVRILGINIWDKPANVAPFLQNTVKMHKKTGDEVMQYTVAIEQKDDANDERNGVMAKTWMAAAGRDGIPSAFVVDQTGHVAWIGHPGRIDDALEQIVAKKWDLATEAKKYAAQVASAGVIKKYGQLFQAGKFDEAYPIGRTLVAGAFADDAAQLNQLAWQIVDPDRKPAKQDLELALSAADRANVLTKGKDPAILDTLAAVHHARGDLAKAIACQRLANDNAKGSQFEKEIAERLAQYEKEAAAQKGTEPGKDAK